MDSAVSYGPGKPLVSPLCQSSVFTLPSLDALDRIYNGEEPGFIYSRDGHPNASVVAKHLAELEGAEWGLVGASGMASIATAVLAMIQQGQRIVASNRLYGRTVQFFEQELGRFGVETAIVDCNDLAAVEEALKKPTRILFVETLSNPLLRMIDVPALAELAHRHDCHLIVDNTFATPVLLRPLDMGADVVMESLTKMIGGHGDVTLGLIAGKGDPELVQAVTATASIWGFYASPFECWLTERGLPTLDLRMRAACQGALEVAGWLKGQPGVSRVIYPGLADHPDHALAKRLMPGGYGHMLCFELAGGRDAVNRFIAAVPEVPFSPSLGSTTTTLSHPWTTSHRNTAPAQKKRQGITEGLIRLSVGIEPAAVIEAAMAKGLK